MQKNFIHYLWALLCVAMFVSCHKDELTPEEIQKDATDLLTLAEAQLGQARAVAEANLIAAKFEKDAHVDSLFWAKTREDGYIILTSLHDSVVVVDIAQEHATMKQAQLTAEIFSRYGYRTALPDVHLWGAMTICGDSTYYLDGSVVPTISMLVTGMAMMNLLPKELIDQFSAALKKDRGVFSEDVRANSKDLEYSIEGGAYTRSWVELVKDASQIDWTKLLMNNPFLGKKLFSFYTVETAIHQRDSKTQTYRCTYRHGIEIPIDPNEGMPFPGFPEISFR
ncbi:MAG: hypothetical protein MJZ89_02445 [Paludibacteraceae bacterium]|nr:hypothetical protein [Paludibacteraceae bacterium]